MTIKPDEYTELVNEVIAFKLEAVKEYIAEKIGPIGDIGTPEKFIGKSVENWTPEDVMILSNLYGAEVIKKAIVKREIERYHALKAELEV